MSVWANLISRLSRSLPSRSSLQGRDLQLHLDTATLYRTLPPPRHATTSIPAQTPTPEQTHIASLLNITSPLPPFETQAAALIGHLHAGSARVLRALAKAFPSNQPLQALRDALGYLLCVRDSSVQGAGRGVFVHGLVKKGSVVTLYPGLSYLPSQIRRSRLAGGDDNAASRADYFISRYDGVVIDGSVEVEVDATGLISQTQQADGATSMVEVGRQAMLGEERELTHPLGLGHLVNHPPKGMMPNVLQFMVDLDLNAMPREMRTLVPCRNCGNVNSVIERMENVAFQQRVPSSAAFVSGIADANRLVRTVALVATRDISDEEVFMNYRFNPAAPGLPDWYSDCDPEGSARRWKGKGVFF